MDGLSQSIGAKLQSRSKPILSTSLFLYFVGFVDMNMYNVVDTLTIGFGTLSTFKLIDLCKLLCIEICLNDSLIIFDLL